MGYQIVQTVSARQRERGISTAELARRTGINYEQLRLSLDEKRQLKACELVPVCAVLGLELADFGKERSDAVDS